MSTGQAITIGMSLGAAIALSAVAFIILGSRTPDPRPPAVITQRPGPRNDAEAIAVCARFHYRGQAISERLNLDPASWRPTASGFAYANTLTVALPVDVPNPAEVQLIVDWFDLDNLFTIRPFANVDQLWEGDLCTVTELGFTISDITSRRKRP